MIAYCVKRPQILLIILGYSVSFQKAYGAKFQDQGRQWKG